MEPTFHSYPPVVDVKRLAELEAMAKERNANFYTLEVTPYNKITLSRHCETIYTKRIGGAEGVPFETVLDAALVELKAHIIGHRNK